MVRGFFTRFSAGAGWAALGPVLALFLAGVLFTSQSERFLTGQNFSLILQQAMVVGVLAIGQTLVILVAGIDLSCGMVMALSSVVVARCAVDYALPVPVAIVAGMAVASGFGLLNGLLVARAGLPSFIVTLGTLNIAAAITQLYSGSQSISGLPDALAWWGERIRFSDAWLTHGVVLMFVLYALMYYLLHHTALGRHIYAIGNSLEAARLVGIPTTRRLIGVYTIAGGCYGIAALLLIARTGAGDPNAGQTENLDTITAVVLGGTSLFGGRGGVLMTLVGVCIIGVLRNGLTLMGVSPIYQVLVTGILVILAVLVDRLLYRRQL